jgi:glucose-6-phosphate isomerase
MDFGLEYEYYPKVSKRMLTDANKVIGLHQEKWEKPFFTDTKSFINLEEIRKISKDYIKDNIKNVIVLGTGGSIQTLLALKHLATKKIIPITNSRAMELKSCLETTTPQDSIVIPISRGGETLDINSTIGIFLKRGYPFIGLSSKGTMYQLLKDAKVPILDVPDLSGRFVGSISNVGIVPAFIAGIDINDFLFGLEEGYKSFMDLKESLAYHFAVFLYSLYKLGYKIVFSMPYSLNLEGSVGLFVQELSESTGKNEKGLMGAFQSAPLCQHSVLEFLLGGTKGIVVPILWNVNNELRDVTLPSSIEYIDEQSAQTIINYQVDATFQALIEQRVPSAKISVENVKAHNIGNLIAFIQACIYYLCLLLDVNWANNPKVVIGKEICNDALMNRLSAEKRKKNRIKIAENAFKDFFSNL